MKDKVKIDMPIGYSVKIENDFKERLASVYQNSDFHYTPTEGIERPRVRDFDFAFRPANQRGQEVQVAAALEDHTSSIQKAWSDSFHTHDQGEPR